MSRAGDTAGWLGYDPAAKDCGDKPRQMVTNCCECVGGVSSQSFIREMSS